MPDREEECSQRTIRVTNDINFAEMKLLNQGGEIIRIDDSGVAGAGFVPVGNVVSAAIGNGAEPCLCEVGKLIVPIRTVAQRPVYKDDWRPLSVLLVGEFHLVADSNSLQRRSGDLYLCSERRRKPRKSEQNKEETPSVGFTSSDHLWRF